MAAQPAVERFFEEPFEHRADFYLRGCDRHRSDWTCTLVFVPDDRVGYSLGVERWEEAYWVERADLIVL